MKKIFFALAILMGLGTVADSQPPNLDSVKQELYRINKVFDSSWYLGFDVNIKYSSDTVYGDFEYEEMDGKYIMSKNNVYYKMGTMEYVQNDSFTYSLYHDEKMLIMTKDAVSGKSSMFPLREFVDSVITWYATSYTINLSTEDDSKVIEFSTTDTLAPYRRFAIYYEGSTYYPDRFEVESGFDPPINSPAPTMPIKKKIVVSFTNYYHPVSLDIFNDSKYVYYDKVHKRFQPSQYFKDYRFMANGVEAADDDDTIELYPPPPEQ